MTLTPEQIEAGMTRDEAEKIFEQAVEAYQVTYSDIAHAISLDLVEKIATAKPKATEAAATVIQQAFAERDGEIAMLTEALRGCGRAVEGGAKEPRANVRFIVGETLHALAAKG